MLQFQPKTIITLADLWGKKWTSFYDKLLFA